MQPVKTTLGALLLALAATLAVTPSAGAAVLHVTDGSGDCTTQARGCSLAAALGAAASGDSVRVHAGVHGVSGILSDGASGVTIEGAPDESRPVIAISGPMSGLELTHGTNLSSLDVVSTGAVAIKAFGGVIERVRISSSGQATAGVQLGNGAILRNSVVSVTGSASVGVLVSTGGGLTQLRGSSVLATGHMGSAVLVAPLGSGSTSSLRAVNSILRGYGGALDVRAVTSSLETATVVLDHSATTHAAQQVVGPGAAIDDSRAPLAAEPRFLDRGNLDLRQIATSPTIDAGTADLDGDGNVDADDVAAAGAFDLDGTARQLGPPDIGADEREMPPIVLSAQPFVTGGRIALRVVVQPRGLDTLVTVEWSSGADSATTGTTAAARGNTPVSLEIPLGDVPSGTQIAVRARASNSAGSSTSDDTTVAVPEETTVTKTTTTPSPTVAPPPSTPLTGTLPTIVSTKVRSHWGIVDLKLTCAQPVSCRGMALITRLGKGTRWTTFKIAPGASKTITLSLTSAQTRKLRAAGKRGARVLIELRSTQMGSSWTAVQLGAGATPAAAAKPKSATPKS